MSRPAATGRGRTSSQRIIDTASALFYRGGVNATGMNAIARASGTGKSQLYHYFSDKPDLVLAVIDQLIANAVLPQRGQLEDMGTAADLRAWADQAVAHHEAGGPVRCPLGALAVEVANHPRLREALANGFAEWRKLIARGLRRLQDNGVVRTDRPAEDLAEVLLCAYEGGVLLSEVHGSAASLRLALDAAVDSVLLPAGTLHPGEQGPPPAGGSDRNGTS